MSLLFLFEIAREQKKDKEIAEKYDIRGLHLLAAEDNELNAEIIEMLLTDDGAKVTVAKNGRQAVEYFESNSPGTFDAILMDVMMPVMDGIAATKAIRAMDRADAKIIPIIAMTANAFEEDAKKMSCSRHDCTFGKTFPDRRCGENHCGVLWKVKSINIKHFKRCCLGDSMNQNQVSTFCLSDSLLGYISGGRSLKECYNCFMIKR